jgi:hypothetical protein
MALPAKSYFMLEDVAAAWGVAVRDLVQLAVEGRLQLSILMFAHRLEVGWMEEDGEDAHWVAAGTEIVNGPQPVIAGDIWPVLGKGVAQVSRFPDGTENWFRRLPEGTPPIEVTLDMLVVTRAERTRFEAEHGLISAERPEPFTHRPDYSEVSLNGALFTLGPLQASVVRQLHRAAMAGRPWMEGTELLAASGSRSGRLVDLFKKQPNWRSLIVSDHKGNWRLNIAIEHAASSARAFRRPRLTLVR